LSSRIDTVSLARKQGLMEKRRQKYKQYENIAYEKREIKQKEALLFR